MTPTASLVVRTEFSLAKLMGFKKFDFHVKSWDTEIVLGMLPSLAILPRFSSFSLYSLEHFSILPSISRFPSLVLNFSELSKESFKTNGKDFKFPK